MLRGVPLPPAAVERRRRSAQALGLIRHPLARRWPDRPWTPEELALLGTAPDGAVALLVKRGRFTVRRERVKLGIPAHGPNGVTKG